jgi:hypothetical protein
MVREQTMETNIFSLLSIILKFMATKIGMVKYSSYSIILKFIVTKISIIKYSGYSSF